MALPRQRNWRRLPRQGGNFLPEEEAAIRTRHPLGLCGGHRLDVPGTDVAGCEDHRSTGDKAVGIAAIHRAGSGWESFLLPSWLIKDRISSDCLRVDVQ